MRGLTAKVSLGLVLGAVSFLGVLGGAVFVAACVNPQQDYEDYTARTADAHAPPKTGPTDGGADVALYAPDAGFMGKYLMACLPDTAAGNTSEAIIYAANMTYTATSGGGGQLTFSNKPLVVGATNFSDTVGSSSSPNPNPVSVAANGTATMNFGPTVVPAQANPINMSDVDFSSLKLVFHVESAAQICSNLTGNGVVQGISTTITGTCVYLPVPSGSLPSLQLSEFHCP